MITPATVVYTFTRNSAGEALIDSVLGNQTPEEYQEIFEGNGEIDERAIEALCEWLDNAEGFFLSEEEAESFAEDNMSRRYSYKLESFTPAGIHEEIMDM